MSKRTRLLSKLKHVYSHNTKLVLDVENKDIELIIEGLEKQIAKKPTYEGNGYSDGELVYDEWLCPNCNTRYEVDYDNYDYCPKCGQKLDY